MLGIPLTAEFTLFLDCFKKVDLQFARPLQFNPFGTAVLTRLKIHRR
jgi:hypothetical protein